jgi:hypothetical protein
VSQARSYQGLRNSFEKYGRCKQSFIATTNAMLAQFRKCFGLNWKKVFFTQ